MTVDEILACEIPEGKYEIGLKLMFDEIKRQMPDECNPEICYCDSECGNILLSICTNFEALYHFAKGYDPESDAALENDSKLADEYNRGYYNGVQQGRTKALDEALGAIANEKPWIEKYSNATVMQSISNIVNRIERMKKEGE